MRTLSTERLELIDALVAEASIGDITAGLLEKDEHLTAALQAVFGLSFQHASLVFCGGTSLSKAHSLIERMSEDADIKVVLAPATASWSKTQLRRYLGDEVRGQVITALEDLGFVEVVDSRRSLNDNQYIHSQWTYKRAYDGIAALRPNLQLELIARSPILPTQTASLGTLADKLAGLAGSTFSVPVVSVAETLAEKVLSFLRSDVVLTDHQAHVVEQLVSSGRYQNASEVLRDGLRLVEKREAEDALRLEALRSAVKIGIADIEAGRFTTFDTRESLGSHLKSIAAKAIAGA